MDHPDWAPRERCYHAIRNAINTELIKHYTAHRSWLGDERSASEIKASHDGLLEILKILDSFDIADKILPSPEK